MHKSFRISRLPAEILGEVLLTAKCDGIEITDPTTYPMNLCLVCKTWRSVVLSTPKIWSHIRVNLDRSGPKATATSTSTTPGTGPSELPHNAILGALQTCLDRSKSQPLALRIVARSLIPSSGNESTSSNNPDSRARDLLASVLVTLLRYSNRWAEVELDFALDLFMFIFPRGRHYPSLGKLILRCESGSLQSSPWIWNFESLFVPWSFDGGTFSDTPRLTELEIYRLPVCIRQLSLPWYQITSLKISLIENIFTSGLKLASTMPRLISLSLRQVIPGLDAEGILHPPIDSDESHGPHECALLEELSLSCWHGVPLSTKSFFLGLRTPKLRILRLLLPGDSSPLEDWFHAFKTFISRSYCTIRQLTLTEMNGATVLAILRTLGSVEELALERTRFTKGLTLGLTYQNCSGRTEPSSPPSKRGPVGKRVSKLTIVTPLFVDHAVGPDHFIAMICSRLPRPSPPPSKAQNATTTISCSPSAKGNRAGNTLKFLRILTTSPRDSRESFRAGDLYPRLSRMLLGHQWDDLGIKVVLEDN